VDSSLPSKSHASSDSSLPSKSHASSKKAATRLEQAVHDALTIYLEQHDGLLPATGLYNRVIEEVERPLIFLTLQFVDGNQSKAASILGLSRNTFRKKVTTLLQQREGSDKLKKLATSI
jgi:two-component system nitrogen regulation response regulator GlnG